MEKIRLKIFFAGRQFKNNGGLLVLIPILSRLQRTWYRWEVLTLKEEKECLKH